MYETYYGLSAKPFQLRPDPHFFYGSKGHKRAMAYLEYGLSQGEGFIVITGEVGAGKTTLVRNMLGKLPLDQIVAAHIVNTSLDPEDTLRMVVSSFGLPYEGQSKAELLNRLEQFLRTVEELRMLSNFQTDERSLLQTFLLGQPEFRATLHSPGMQQLRQRVIASYHLGPMDANETRAYVEHRLATVGWQGTPSFDDGAYSAIYAYSGGIPRKTNTLMDRVLLMGYLEELQAFTEAHINDVVRDISEEFDAPDAFELADAQAASPLATSGSGSTEGPGERRASVEQLDERMMRLEKSIVSVLSILKKIAATPSGTAPGAASHHPDNQE